MEKELLRDYLITKKILQKLEPYLNRISLPLEGATTQTQYLMSGHKKTT